MTKRDNITPTVLFFTYGTLRRGERLHGWLSDNIIEDLGPATMKGTRLFYARGHRQFPYLVTTGSSEDVTVGEVYRVPLNEAIVEMFQMEVNAGYRIMDMEAFIGDEPMNVVVCVCADEAYCGTPVPDNDWCSVERVEWWA